MNSARQGGSFLKSRLLRFVERAAVLADLGGQGELIVDMEWTNKGGVDKDGLYQLDMGTAQTPGVLVYPDAQ